MNREVHVRICEGRGLRCPRLLGSDEEKAVSTPEGAPDTGTITNNYVFQLVTGAAVTITGPSADKTIAVTDAKYFTPQPRPGERQPNQRKLTVEGTAPGGDASIMLNGVQVPVTGGKWRGELPVTAAQLGRLTLKASDGTSTVEQRDTLIDIVITKPAENDQNRSRPCLRCRPSTPP